ALRCTAFSALGAAMRRRDFVKGLVGSTAAWPLRAYAQQSLTPVIGFLHSGIAEQTTQLDSFRMGLKESGFEDGRDVSVQYRFAEGRYDRLPALAAELVRQPVAVLFAGGGVHTAIAAKSATAYNSHRFFDRQRSCAIRFGCKP